jgi:DNA-binding transcriptional MerR regulator
MQTSIPVPVVRAAEPLADTFSLNSAQILVPRPHPTLPLTDNAGLPSWLSFIPKEGIWVDLVRIGGTLVILLVLILAFAGIGYLFLRVLHTSRFYAWKDPPRRMKRLSFGKDGVSLEYVEEQLAANEQKDTVQENKLAEIRGLLDTLSMQHDILRSQVADLPPTMVELIRGLQTSIDDLDARLRNLEEAPEEQDG